MHNKLIGLITIIQIIHGKKCPVLITKIENNNNIIVTLFIIKKVSIKYLDIHIQTILNAA